MPVGTGRSLAGLAAALVTLAGCGDDVVAPDPDPSGSVRIVPPASADIVVGDVLELSATVTGAHAPRWTTTDTSVANASATASGARVEARRTGIVDVVAKLDGGASDRLTVRVLARPGGYPAEAVDYFAAIEFGSEYGSSEPVVRRWGIGPTLRVNGSPTARDRLTLNQVLDEINALTTTVDVAQVDTMPSVEVHFAPQATFPGLLPSYVPGNVGFFTVWWDATQHIYRAVVLISSEIDQSARDHILREEVTQILGLMRDSFRYPESIFYQNWTLVTEYAPVDEAVIEMLYRPELPTGAPAEEAVRLLRTLTRTGPAAVDAGAEIIWSRASRVGRPGMASGGHRR
jgi:hypothetical protein